ncbi:hypothetical protein RQP46_004212 [Phenoliferia psychrophenolica]
MGAPADLTAKINTILGESNLAKPVDPATYAMFEHHFAHFPNDGQLLLTDGGATVFCMESQCGTQISVTPGSLIPFQHHCLNDATHKAVRDARVKAIQKVRVTLLSLKTARSVSQDLKLTLTLYPPLSLTLRSPVLQEQPVVNKPQAPVASGSGSGGFGIAPAPKKKRSSSPTGASQHKKHKPAFAAAAAPGVLADKVNRQQPANYAELWAALEKQEKVQKAALVGLQATGGGDAAYYDSIDAAKAQISQVEKRIRDYKNLYGVPAGVVPGGQPAVSGADAMRARAKAAHKHAGAGAAGPMIDALDDLPQKDQHDFEDEFTGATAGGEDFSAFLAGAAEGQDFEGNFTVDAAAEKLSLAHHKALIPGMCIPLMPHQIIGVAWMREQEDSKWYGGILADEMGLGKTVQTIACMAHNQSEDPTEKTTLILAPLALLQQWKTEILDKMDANHWRVLIHHGKDRAKTAKELARYDVVLTTYHTLAGEWPDEEGAMKKSKKGKKKAGSPESEEDDFVTLKKAGPLYNVSWYRVVLDEAQNIRNRSTKISRSVSHIDALYRWCLTGTPITNSLSDLFPLFRFLQVKPWFVWKDWREHVMVYEKKNPDMAGKRAQAVLSRHCLRRKKTTQLDGKDLVTLPNKTVELKVLEFTAEEREIYTFVETRAQVTFNKFLKAGTVLKNYASVLVMLLRLRQLCLHPCLISDGYDALATNVADEKKLAIEIDHAKGVMGSLAFSKLRKKMLERMLEIVRAEQKGEEPDDNGDGDCPICMEPLQDQGDAVVTKCSHAYCKTCITDVLQGPAVDADDNDANAVKYKASERPCPNCRQPISEDMLFPLKVFEPTDAELEEATGDMNVDSDEERSADEASDSDDDEMLDFDEMLAKKNAKKLAKSKGKGKASSTSLAKAPKQNNRAVIIDSDDEEDQLEPEEISSTKAGKQKEKELPGWMASQEPSTKLIWLEQEISRLRDEHPDEKTLVISQFTTALDLVADYLSSKGHKVTRYQGDMNSNEREESVRILAKSKKCMVMLLKCGGVGLNLVRANNVVNMDLAWSHAVEQQAFDRCHRIGQSRDVIVSRLTIANTVEQRIGDLQERKKQLADASLGEGTGKRLGKLTVADLANLFGLDARGKRQAAIAPDSP